MKRTCKATLNTCVTKSMFGELPNSSANFRTIRNVEKHGEVELHRTVRKFAEQFGELLNIDSVTHVCSVALQVRMKSESSV